METKALNNAKKAPAASVCLGNASSCLPLEREYWQALKILAYANGWNNWREFFLMQILSENPGSGLRLVF